MEYKWEPNDYEEELTLCDGCKKEHKIKTIKNQFSGYVMLDIPSHDERNNNLLELTFDIDGDQKAKLKNNIEASKTQATLIKKYIKKVKIKHTKSKKPLESIDELLFYNDSKRDIYDRVADVILSGPSLGNE